MKITKYLIYLKGKLKLTKNFSKFNLNNIKKKLEITYKIKIDYLELRNEKNLKKINSNKNLRLFIALNINNVRLIDNY
jgi:Panthothenate synthetase